MKKFLDAIPFALILALVPFLFYSTPTLPQALILLGISALCGYRYYCMEQVKPDLVAIFEETFEAYKAEVKAESDLVKANHEKAMIHLDKKVKELSANYGKTTMNQANKTDAKPKFVF